MTNSIDDLGDETGCYFIIGSNTTENHPIIGDRIKKAVRARGAKLIVADPRKIPLVDQSNVFLQVPPGYNIAVVNAMMNVILAEGLEDKAYIAERCEGFEEFSASLSDFTPEKVGAAAGIDPEAIREAARLYATCRPSAILYAMGVTQHTQGTDGVKALANLAMLCGNVGVAGGGVNPLRGQNNVQGACDVGGLPDVFTGYQKVADDAARQKFEKAWNATLSPTPGMKLTDMGHAITEGKLKALYVMGENPMITDPDLKHIEKALDAVDFLIVQDIFYTETAAKADVVFPVSSFAEKDGTFTNTERRIQRVRAAMGPVADIRADWQVISEISTRMGYPMGYADAEAVFAELAALTPSYQGVTYERIDKEGLAWPCPAPDHPGTPILHVGQFARGKGLFSAIDFKGPEEKADPDYPFILTTGREHAHYHSGTMTRRCARINDCFPEGFMEMNPADAQKLGIAEGDSVAVASRRGEITTKVSVMERTAPGTVFLSFHYSESPVNVLTNPAVCPTAKIPEYKVTAVKIRKV